MFHPADGTKFLIYLLCMTARGRRITANEALIPAGFLILLLGFRDLSLPELLVIAVLATSIREIRNARTLPRVFGVIYSAASITVGIVCAYRLYQGIAKWGLSALFPAPLIAGAAIFLYRRFRRTSDRRSKTRSAIATPKRTQAPIT